MLKYIYVDKKDNTKRYKFKELQELYRANFETYTQFSEWVDENFEEKTYYTQTPQERTRNYVYATGNKWAIENFNATH
jgi:hypothetical protein